MFTERLLSKICEKIIERQLRLYPVEETQLPAAEPDKKYMLYLHVPFCEVLCPYCSFNRYTYKECLARPYFESLRAEMRALVPLGYDIETLYFGGGTPTVLMEELIATIDEARSLFDIKEVSVETNPNHLTDENLTRLSGRVQRLSVGVQSFDDDLLRKMDRYEKYGSGEQILEDIARAIPYFKSLNVDMIFNFPTQTEDVLLRDLELIALCGCRQVTFSPLYRSRATTAKLESALGKIDYDKERVFYHIVDEVLCGGDNPLFDRETLWTFNRRPSGHGDGDAAQAGGNKLLVEEYAVAYEEYPAIGSGSISPLDHTLFVNTFSLGEYSEKIAGGHMSVMGKTAVTPRNFERYWFLLNLYHQRLDKKMFKEHFGRDIERELPAELAFLRACGAFETDDKDELTLSPRGRYLVVVMYRQYLSGLNNLREAARSVLSGDESQLAFEPTR